MVFLFLPLHSFGFTFLLFTTTITLLEEHIEKFAEEDKMVWKLDN